MKRFTITIKEYGHNRPIVTHYSGDDNLTKNDMVEFFGLKNPDVEHYQIEEE